MGTGIIGIIFYLVILKINLAITSLKLASYAGTDTFGITSFAGYLQRIADAYSDFFVPNIEAEYCMFPFHFAGWHRILLASMILSAVILMILLVKNGYAVSAFQFMLALVLLPAAINFNMILYDKQNMHSLHQYHLCMLFVLWYILARTLSLFWKEGIFRKISSCMCSFTAVFCLIFGCLYIRYDNCCYMLAEFRHQRVTAYYTTLITRIQSLDGYNPGSPVCYINAREKIGEADTILIHSDPIVTNPYNKSLLNNYVWWCHMFYYNGYKPYVIDESYFDGYESVEFMPSYPNDGAIQYIDGIIVVKF